MFGIKLSKQALQQHFNKGKNFLGRAYHHTKSFLNSLDKGVNIARDVHQQLAPHIDKMGGKDINTKIGKGLNGYDTVKNQVLDAHNATISGLRKNNIHI